MYPAVFFDALLRVKVRGDGAPIDRLRPTAPGCARAPRPAH
jgi:hypothetical protein